MSVCNDGERAIGLCAPTLPHTPAPRWQTNQWTARSQLTVFLPKRIAPITSTGNKQTQLDECLIVFNYPACSLYITRDIIEILESRCFALYASGVGARWLNIREQSSDAWVRNRNVRMHAAVFLPHDWEFIGSLASVNWCRCKDISLKSCSDAD